VIATNVSDNAYVIPDHRAGHIVPLHDEACLAERVCRLLGDERTRVELARGAREWVIREFSTSRLAAKTEKVYTDALEAVRSRSGVAAAMDGVRSDG
jgi:glycosyltransferase involved in cell wall biosynthesis